MRHASSHLMVSRLILAALVIALLSTRLQAGTLNDLWWTPSESGWGVNVIQQEDVLFLSLFVYGADGKPTWYVGPETRKQETSSSHSGPLYETSGPWFGSTFDSHAVGVREIGAVTFTPNQDGTARLEYIVGNTVTRKNVERQTWRPILFPTIQGFAPFSGTVQKAGVSVNTCAGGEGGIAPDSNAKAFSLFSAPSDGLSGSIRLRVANLDLFGSYVQTGSVFRVQLETTVSTENPGYLPPGHYIGGIDPLVVDGSFMHGYVRLSGDNGCRVSLALAGHVNVITYFLP